MGIDRLPAMPHSVFLPLIERFKRARLNSSGKQPGRTPEITFELFQEARSEASRLERY